MNDFIQFFSKQLGKPQTLEDRIVRIWNEFCDFTLTNTKESVLNCRMQLCELLKVIKSALQGSEAAELVRVFEQHQFIRQLITFSMADTPHGLVDELTQFFYVMVNPPFVALLKEEFLIGPLNMFLESSQPSNSRLFEKFLESLLEWVTSHPEDYRLFLVSETSAPLFHHFSQLLVTKYTKMGPILLQLLNAANNIDGLEKFLLSYSPIISTLIGIVEECLSKKENNDEIAEFFEYLNLSMKIAPPLFSISFATAFQNEIIHKYIFTNNEISCLNDSMYVLCFFDSHILISSLLEHLSTKLKQFLESKDEKSQFLAIRCLTLIAEKANVNYSLVTGTPNITQNYINLIDKKLSLETTKSGVSGIRNRVFMNLENIENENISFDISTLLSNVLSIMSNYSKNSLRINIALTELISLLASLNSHSLDYIIFDEECENGLYKTIKQIIENFNETILKDKDILTILQSLYDDFENSSYILYVEHKSYIVLVEFLKELNTISQTKLSLKTEEQFN